jgi:hypothetical protein
MLVAHRPIRYTFAHMSLALHFLTGKDKGMEFPLPEDKDLVIGRTKDNDLLFDSEYATHQHAIISATDGKMTIKDLRSGLDTLVNGRRVTQMELKEGDRVKIGDVKMMVIGLTRFSPAVQGGSGGTEFVFKNKRASGAGAVAARALSGSLKEVSLTDVLQFLSHSHKDGVLRLSLPGSSARIHVRSGRIVHASWEGQAKLNPVRILYRLLRQKAGTFDFGAPEERVIEEEIDHSTESLLLEGSQEADEISSLLENFPPLDYQVEASRPAGKVRLRDLKPDELDVLEMVLSRPTIQMVIDRHPQSDLAAVRNLSRLFECGFVIPVPVR